MRPIGVASAQARQCLFAVILGEGSKLSSKLSSVFLSGFNPPKHVDQSSHGPDPLLARRQPPSVQQQMASHLRKINVTNGIVTLRRPRRDAGRSLARAV
jgi:hypothetical protein